MWSRVWDVLGPGREVQSADDTVYSPPWIVLHTPVEGGQIVKHPGGRILGIKKETEIICSRK